MIRCPQWHSDLPRCSEDSDVSVQWMEILTGTGQRRGWPRTMREQIVSETLAAEVTLAEVARRHDLDHSLVYRWRSKSGMVERSGDPLSGHLFCFRRHRDDLLKVIWRYAKRSARKASREHLSRERIVIAAPESCPISA